MQKNLFVIIILVFCGCTMNQTRMTLGNEENNRIGWISQEGDMLHNPHQDRARIFVLRKYSNHYWDREYEVRVEFDPKIDESNEPNSENYQGALGSMINGTSFYADIKGDIPINLSAMGESASYIYFAPQKGKVYCVLADVNAGFFGPRPDLKLLNRKECEILYPTLKRQPRIQEGFIWHYDSVDSLKH